MNIAAIVKPKDKLRVLVGCEESQVVTKAFRAKGHEAYSCDLKPCSGGHPEWHIQDDVRRHLNNEWDIGIFHPACTRLANSGVMWLKKRDLWKEMEAACQFFNEFINAPISKICVENPIPHKYAVENIGKYSQIIQPWMFGHTERKATCLWLKNLDLLRPTNNVKEEMLRLPKREQQRIHYLPPSKDRAELRSKTFPGIANAMALTWG